MSAKSNQDMTQTFKNNLGKYFGKYHSDYKGTCLGYLHSFILLYAGTCFFHISYSQREILDIFEFYVMPE